MGFFDKAKRLFGLGDAEGEEERVAEAAAAAAPSDRGGGRPPTPPASGDPRAARLEKARGRKDRPPLADLPPSQGQSVEDALVAREAGDRKEARRILAAIDRGAGLRVVLRAAAALEAGDDAELQPLLPAVAGEAAGFKLWLQVAGAMGAAGHDDDPEAAATAAMDLGSYLQRAVEAGAPAWALAWVKALSADPTARREGMVELLFADAPLARTVAARDLGVEGAVPDPEAATRYAAFAHGRDCIRRFGARVVADLLEIAVVEGRPA